MNKRNTLRTACSIAVTLSIIAASRLLLVGVAHAQSQTTAWQNGTFNVDVPNVVAQSNIVLGHANTAPQEFMPLGNGKLGVGAWAASGFTAQLNRVDTFPSLKSPGWVVISGLTGLGGGTLDLYNAKLTRSGGGMTATTYVLQNKDELVVDVTGAN